MRWHGEEGSPHTGRKGLRNTRASERVPKRHEALGDNKSGTFEKASFENNSMSVIADEDRTQNNGSIGSPGANVRKNNDIREEGSLHAVG